MLDLRALLPVVSQDTQPVLTMSHDALLWEVAPQFANDPNAVVLVLASDSRLLGAIRGDTLTRMADRAPYLRLAQLPLSRLAFAEPTEEHRVPELLSTGHYLGVLVGAPNGSVLITSTDPGRSD